MKKSLKIFLIILVTLCFSSCQISQYEVQGLSIKDKTKSACYDKSVEILRCFDEKDAEGLKSLFCRHSQENPNIYKEIEGAFDFYKGKSVSFEFKYRGGVAGSWRDGKAVDEHVNPKIENIITDEEKIFHIVYEDYLIYSADKKNVGITFMLLYDEENGGMVQIGKYID